MRSCAKGTAVASVLAGQAAAHLQQSGWDPLKVRTLCQDVATLGESLGGHEQVACDMFVVSESCLGGTPTSEPLCHDTVTMGNGQVQPVLK